MFDPVELSKRTEKIVCRDLEKKYYRFRRTRFYMGCSTADCVGCSLRCVYCWSMRIVARPEKVGNFYSPQEVSEKLVNIANRFGLSNVRISGGEPTIGKAHLLKVIDLIPAKLNFVLETNGILIGHDKNYAEDLNKFKNLHVRVSLKGGNSQEFSKLTGSEPKGFELQLKALENLEKFKVSHHPAVIDLVKDLGNLEKRLEEINPDLPNNLETEPLIKYPQVVARLKKTGLI